MALIEQQLGNGSTDIAGTAGDEDSQAYLLLTILPSAESGFPMRRLGRLLRWSRGLGKNYRNYGRKE